MVARSILNTLRVENAMWVFAFATLVVLEAVVWLIAPSAAIALAVGAAAAALAVALLVVRWTVYKATIALLLVLSEIGLPNKLFAITLPNGDNLIGIRDVLIVAVILIGLIAGRANLRQAARDPLLKPGLLLTLLVPVAAVVGLVHGGNALIAVREVFTLSCGWLLAWSIAANIRDWESIRRLLNLSVVLGVLIAIGASIEILSENRLQLVSQFQVEMFSGGYRTFPDGAVLMFFAWSIAGAVLLTKGLKTRYTLVALLVGLGTILSATRGYLYAYVAALACVLVIAQVARTSWIKAGRILLTLVLLVAVVATAAYTVGTLSGGEAIEKSLDRYINIAADAEGRIYELTMIAGQMVEHPILGAGLGVKYRERLTLIVESAMEADSKWHDTGTFVHNILALFLLKFGPLGLLFFLLFVGAVIRTTYRTLKEPAADGMSTYVLGICIFLIYCLIEAQASNIFGDPKQVPIVGVILGLFVALRNLSPRGAAPVQLPQGPSSLSNSISGPATN